MKKRATSISLVLAGLVTVVGLAALAITASCGGGKEKKATLNDIETYAKTQTTSAGKPLTGKAAVYIDFSDGLNFAFGSDETKLVLQDIVNKIAGEGYDFYSLANNQITDLDNSKVTSLYNTILNPKSFENHSAPIQKALEQIVSQKKPALLITDFEEYNEKQIQKAAYAQNSFVEWITAGYNITFYQWSFVEGKAHKEKKLFITVFDDQANSFGKKIEEAINQSHPTFVQKFVLAGKGFHFPMVTNYLSSTAGGGYHNDEGKDPIMGVVESGTTSFKNFNAGEQAGEYAWVDYSDVTPAQFYPLAFKWEKSVPRFKKVLEKGKEDHLHFLSRLYVDFVAQNGYDIESVEAKVFNVNQAVKSINDSIQSDKNNPVQLKDLFVADIEEDDDVEVAGIKASWNEILVDFDERFNGDKFPKGTLPTDLLRIDVSIAKVEPNNDKVRQFFAWPDNNSLVSSVVNTLENSEVSPKGRVLVSYYVINMAKQ